MLVINKKGRPKAPTKANDKYNSTDDPNDPPLTAWNKKFRYETFDIIYNRTS